MQTIPTTRQQHQQNYLNGELNDDSVVKMRKSDSDVSIPSDSSPTILKKPDRQCPSALLLATGGHYA